MGEALNFLFKLGMIFFFGFIICLIWISYSFFFRDNKIFKSKEKPIITWELKTNGKKIDTVYIYKFK